MARITVPYQYRDFRYSSRATFIDKYTHHPWACFALGALVGILHMVIGCVFFNIGDDHSVGILEGIGCFLVLIGFVWWLLGAVIIPKLSDHFDWAGRVAKKEMRKRLESIVKQQSGMSDENQQ